MVQTLATTSQGEGENGIFDHSKSKIKNRYGYGQEDKRKPKAMSGSSRVLKGLTKMGCQNIHNISKGLPLDKLSACQTIKRLNDALDNLKKSDDLIEGVSAFKEKRLPRWK